jgi:early secretory antigenic target protein ESAT-6
MAGTQDAVGAGAAGFGTTVEEMARAGRHVLDVDAEVQADLASLRGQLVPLQGAWVGEAATTFSGLMARWDADARALSEALRAIGEAIQGSGSTYQRQEEAQYSGLSAIRAALG